MSSMPPSPSEPFSYRVRRYFSVDEATLMIPFLEESFEKVSALRNEIGDVLGALREAGIDPAEDDFDADSLAPEQARRVTYLNRLVERANEVLGRVQDAGIVVKDIDTGLCDFYSRRGNRDVFLCWKVGETLVSHWHDLESGFRGRQPVIGASEFVPSTLN